MGMNIVLSILLWTEVVTRVEGTNNSTDNVDNNYYT